MRIFMWLMSRNRLFTAARSGRILGASSCCHACPIVEETTLHVMRDYPKASPIWNQFMTPTLRSLFFTTPFEVWLDFNIHNDIGTSTTIPWLDIFISTCWWMW
ncbi:Putative ribonuclease H protein [Arachis hypogaea]|nr:Putative ribonuclease H protein [Arachis hypogaea]